MPFRFFSGKPLTAGAPATIALAAAVLAAASLASCAGTPRRSRPDAAEKAGLAPAPRDEVKAAIAEAMALSLAGDPERAMERVSAALASARDRAALAGALEAKAWAMLFADSREAAMEALRESAIAGPAYSPGRAVLEFRLAAQEGIAEARKRAAEALASPGTGERAALAIAVMLGDKDLRDVSIESPEAAAEFATYLSGYSLAPAPAAPVPGTADAAASSDAPSRAGRPVIVVSEPESVGADAATVAIARLACRDALAKRGRFSVVDGDSRRGAIEELELSLSSAGDRDKAIGTLFSADYVASGSVVSSGSGWLVAFSLSSAADGGIVASDFSMAADHAGIMSAASRFAAALDGLAATGF